MADVSAEAGEAAAAACRDAFFYNNAGIMPADDASILETEPRAWDHVLDVNATAAYVTPE
jgi:NAD(P)-dependent dehydrogenase (short-subunit alcohol dehydrogenase family)